MHGAVKISRHESMPIFDSSYFFLCCVFRNKIKQIIKRQKFDECPENEGTKGDREKRDEKTFLHPSNPVHHFSLSTLLTVCIYYLFGKNKPPVFFSLLFSAAVAVFHRHVWIKFFSLFNSHGRCWKINVTKNLRLYELLLN